MLLTTELDNIKKLLAEKVSELQKSGKEIQQEQLENPPQLEKFYILNRTLEKTNAGKTSAQAENVRSSNEITPPASERTNEKEIENKKISEIKERLNKLNTSTMKNRVEMRALLEDIKILAETNPAIAANFLKDEYKSKHIGLYIAELMKENPKATEPLAKFYIAIICKLIVSEHIEKFRALDILFGEFSIQLAKNCMKTPELLEFFARSLSLMVDEKFPSVNKKIVSNLSATLDKNGTEDSKKGFYNTLKHSIPKDVSSAPR